MAERVDRLLERYERDLGFREAVDDMTAAVGLLLPVRPLAGEIGDVVELARVMRGRAATAGTRPAVTCPPRRPGES